MEIYERISLIRKSLKLSRREFGEKLGVSESVIVNIEMNRLSRPEQKKPLYNLICSKYKVDPYWLETGKGDMFLPQTKDDAIASFMASVMADEEESFRRRFVEMLASLDDDGWQFLENTINSLYPKQKKEQE
jgi:transcriptional regulator with XRE-family HTH domain